MSRATLVTGPASEPVTLAEARKQLELPSDDTTHSDHLTLLIQAAREQWEHDTDSCCLTQTWNVTLPYFSGLAIHLPKRPIQSITSITYYDTADESQTLATSVYAFDAAARKVWLKSLQTWPVTYERFDAVTVTFAAGFASAAAVPAIHKQAIRFLIGKYFENRDLMTNSQVFRDDAYEALVSRFMRSSYP